MLLDGFLGTQGELYIKRRNTYKVMRCPYSIKVEGFDSLEGYGIVCSDQCVFFGEVKKIHYNDLSEGRVNYTLELCKRTLEFKSFKDNRS